MENMDINQKSPPSIKHPLDHIDRKSENPQRVGGSPIQVPLMHDFLRMTKIIQRTSRGKKKP